MENLARTLESDAVEAGRGTLAAGVHNLRRVQVTSDKTRHLTVDCVLEACGD